MKKTYRTPKIFLIGNIQTEILAGSPEPDEGRKNDLPGVDPNVDETSNNPYDPYNGNGRGEGGYGNR